MPWYLSARPTGVNHYQNGRTITDTTITIIRTVGTSFIIRYCRPVNVFAPATKSFLRFASQ